MPIGTGRVADDPFAGFVDVLAGGEVHHRVRAPADAPDHFFHFVVDRGGQRRVADVGVDLGEEVAAENHRLEFGMVDVGRDDGAATGNLVAHEFRRDDFGDGRHRNFRRDAGG